YLGRPADAVRIMRELSLGITHENLLHIPERGTGSQAESDTVKKIPPILIDIEGKEFSLTPFSTRLEAGKPLRITFKNTGTASHNMYILERGIGTPIIAPGETAVLDVDPLEPGIYTLYCSVGNHRGQGMEAFIRAL
ncbi:MAG: cupredoxin domain-containing protein, partial [Patescibacteria group bacterium]